LLGVAGVALRRIKRKMSPPTALTMTTEKMTKALVMAEAKPYYR
jgi:hypothetical protein